MSDFYSNMRKAMLSLIGLCILLTFFITIPNKSDWQSILGVVFVFGILIDIILDRYAYSEVSE